MTNIQKENNQKDVINSFMLWSGLSLMIHLIMANYSLGFFHYDEHFQILEFAGMKLGWTKQQFMPWEYNVKIRPALQPMAVYALIKAFYLSDPFEIAKITRYLSGIFGWAVFWFFTWQIKSQLQNDKLKRIFFALSALYFYICFIHVRFSSESIAGTLCFLSITLLLYKWNRTLSKRQNILILVVAGLCMGLGYVCRMQAAVISLSVIVWALVNKKLNIKEVILISFGGILAVGIGLLADRWFYGEWLNTTYGYFKANIIQNKAASFGVMPWYWFFPEIIRQSGIISGILIILSSLYFWLKYPKSILTAVSVPFFILHCLIGHKELRFLFPLISILPFIFVLAYNDLAHYVNPKINIIPKIKDKIVPAALLIVCIINYHYILSPAWRGFEWYKYINDNYGNEEIYVLGLHNDPYESQSIIPLMFYKPHNCYPHRIDNAFQLDSALKQTKKPVFLCISTLGFKKNSIFDSVNANFVLKYSSLPVWLSGNNFNHWQSRTTVLRLYQCMPRP